MNPFDKGFLVGASTAAHQVEGNNVHSDCWALERIPHTAYAEPSGEAVDHYRRYEEDIKLLAGAGLNAYRFSIEWARIEPEEGKFDEAEVEHYRNMIRCCKENGVEPMVTLHHFSSPAWLITKGGWEWEGVADCFQRYCRYVMERLGEELTYVCTINEANIRLQIAGIMKRYMLQAQQAQKAAAQNPEAALQMGMNMKALMEQQQLAELVGILHGYAAHGLAHQADALGGADAGKDHREGDAQVSQKVAVKDFKKFFHGSFLLIVDIDVFCCRLQGTEGLAAALKELTKKFHIL